VSFYSSAITDQDFPIIIAVSIFSDVTGSLNPGHCNRRVTAIGEVRDLSCAGHGISKVAVHLRMS
jgi:hypothetical protein